MHREGPSFRRRAMVNKGVQTEASFPTNCTNTDKHYEELASEQFKDLCKLRDLIRAAMRELACSVYDVVAFKDILFKIEEDLPSRLPVTDMLLLSSKLFRRTSELGRLLGCFFAVVFAEGHADENFHFTELRVLRRELMDVKEKFAQTEKERVNLQRMLDDVGKAAMNHSRAVDLLEARNTALQLQTSGLEDQMALLFAQVNKDLNRQCRDAYEKVTNEIDSQDRMSLTRATFRQTMDSLSDQLRHSRTLINDVRELVMNCAQTPAGGTGRNVDAQIAKEPSIRFKLKQVENNFQQLVGRFASVKGVVAETAQELMNALQERKNILYLSLQHIRLYDIQSSKMRQSKAIIVTMKRNMEEFVKRIGVTFPSGAVTFVDRIGRISTQQWQVGQTLASLRQQKNPEQVSKEDVPQSPIPLGYSSQIRPSNDFSALHDNRLGENVMSDVDLHGSGDIHKTPFQTVYNMLDLIKQVENSVEGLNSNLNFEDEINAFLKTLTLSLSTTPRNVDDAFTELPTEDELMDKVLHPTGNAAFGLQSSPEYPSRKFDPSTSLHAAPTILTSPGHSDRRQSLENENSQSRTQATEDSKRIQKLQEQLENVQPEFAAKINFLRQVYEARICDLEVKETNYHRKLNSITTQKEAKKEGPHRTDRSHLPQPPELSVIEKRPKREDKEQVIKSRSEWQKTKPVLQANKKVREAAINELGKILKRSSPPREKPEKVQSSRTKSSARSRDSSAI